MGQKKENPATRPTETKYERLVIRPLVATDSPICTTHPELVKGLVSMTGTQPGTQFGTQIETQFGRQIGKQIEIHQGMARNPCGCQCLCVCQCMCPCACKCVCPCMCECVDPTDTLKLPDDVYRKLDIKTARLKMTGTYKFRKEKDGGLLFDTETWAVLKLNETAAQTVLLLDGERTCSSIANELGKFYGIASELVFPDVEHFLGILQRLGAAA